MRHLQKDAGAVARVALAAAGAAVFQIQQDLNRVGHQVMGLAALEIDHEADTAGVVFELDAVKPFDQIPRGWTFSFNFRPGF